MLRFQLFGNELKVGVDGLEPSTSASQTRRATNCATPRYPAFIFAKQYNLNANDSQGQPLPGAKINCD